MTLLHFVPLAFRNIRRNKVRSLITLAAIAFGSTALLLAGGFFQDTFLRMREGLIHSHLGHLQIYKKGYTRYGTAHPFDYFIDKPDTLIPQVKAIKGVRLVTQRIVFSGLLSTGDNTFSVAIQAVQPDGEKRLAVIDNIRHADTGLAILEGQNLTEKDPFAIILGQGLARAIDAHPGDSLVLLTNTLKGSLNAFDVTVRGIFASPSKEFDDRGVRMPLAGAARLLRTDMVQSLIVLLNNTESTDAVAAEIEQYVKAHNLDLEVVPWYRLADFYNRVVALYHRQFSVLVAIIAAIVVLSIFNTLNMSISERTREIGTIMAMGYRRSDILKIFMMEGLVLGLVGGVVGLGIGTASGYVLSIIGIPMPPPPGGSVEWKAGIELTTSLLVQGFAMSVFAAVISSLYPAWRASRLVIAEALRHT